MSGHGPPASVSTLCAVVVLFRPEPEVSENLRALVRECGHVVVADNGCPAEFRLHLEAIPGVEWLAMGGNVGVATALNRCLARADARGFKWVITFDQDSMPEPGLADELLATARRIERSGVVGPCIFDPALRRAHTWLRPNAAIPVFFQRTASGGRDIDEVTMVITSGALTSVAAWRAVGGFDETLFIDFVDTDFCLRLRRAGWRVSVSGAARLAHKLGRRERRRALGVSFHPTHHVPVRHYYICRNRPRMIARHGLREPHWLLFELCAAAMWVFRVLAFEGDRTRKITAMILGTWDGLRGRSGICPPERMSRFVA